MTTYKIKQSSPLLYLATMLTVIFLGMFILRLLASNHILPKGESLIFVLCFVPIIGLGFYLPKYTATADREITFDEVGIKLKWVRQFILHNKPDLEFSWTEISDYVFQPERQFDQFKLYFKDGSTFKLHHNNDHDSKDEFREFLLDFVAKVEAINSQNNNKSNHIKLGKTIYETTFGLILAGFAVLIIIAIPIILFAFPTNQTSNYAGLTIACVGAIFFVVQVYIHRKKRKEYEGRFK